MDIKSTRGGGGTMGYDTLQIKLEKMTNFASSGPILQQKKWSKVRISPGDSTHKISAHYLEWFKSYSHITVVTFKIL